MATKLVGRKKVFDENGIEIELEITQKKFDSLDRKGWRRVVLSDLLGVLDVIGNKKIKVLSYLIDNMNSNNEINLTQDEVAKATRISKQIVNSTFKELMEAGLIKKIKRRYVINTRIVAVFGSNEKNTRYCREYGFEYVNHLEETKKTEAIEKAPPYQGELELIS